MSNECCNNNCNQGRDCPERRVADRRAEQHAPCYYDTDRKKPLPGPAASAPSVDRNSMPQSFLAYVAANYSGTVEFADPAWHAKRLWSAAMHGAPQPVDAAQAVPEALDHSDILTSMLWLYRRLPRTYGRMAYIERSIKAVAKFTPIDVDDLMAERNEPVEQPTDTTKGT